MAKVIIQEIKDLGFAYKMFGLDDEAALENFIRDIIDDISPYLNGILGTVYDSATQPVSGRVKMAEKYLVAVEMLHRRINNMLSSVVGAGQELDTSNEQKQMESYKEEAERLIGILLGDTNFSLDMLNTSHFDETAELGGLEVLQ